jgi:hypothetical protein
MPRPGGNPELVHHKMRPRGEESLSEKISIRIAPSMMQRLREIDGDYRQFVRDAISEKFAREEGVRAE